VLQQAKDETITRYEETATKLSQLHSINENYHSEVKIQRRINENYKKEVDHVNGKFTALSSEFEVMKEKSEMVRYHKCNKWGFKNEAPLNYNNILRIQLISSCIKKILSCKIC
jgi:hypothetical protein